MNERPGRLAALSPKPDFTMPQCPRQNDKEERRNVFPSLAISGIGHDGNESMSFSARRRPWAGVG